MSTIQGSLPSTLLPAGPDMHMCACISADFLACSGWHLSWVRVINLTTGARALFTANQWLDSTRPGCQNWVKLLAGPDEATPRLQAQQQQLSPGQLVPRGPPVFGVTELQQASAAGGSRFKGWLHSKQQPGYNVTFVTSNIWGAGTGSKVFFELVGEHGTSGEVQCSRRV